MLFVKPSDLSLFQGKLRIRRNQEKRSILEEFKFSKLRVEERWGAKPLTFPQRSIWKFDFYQISLFFLISAIFEFFPGIKIKSDGFMKSIISKQNRNLVPDWVTICFFKGIISKCLKKEKIEAFWVCGGLFESHQNRLHQEISCQLFEILRCAFNVLSDVEKMSYLDVRNGVEKFRICTFWGGG